VWRVSDCEYLAPKTIAKRIGPITKKKKLVERLIGHHCGGIKKSDSSETIDCSLHE
jgi:hypothetical protein